MSGWSKARKIILIVILILAVIVGGGFYWAKKQVNNLVSEAENVPRQSVKQSIDEWFKLPTGSSNTAGEAAKEAQDGGEALNGSSSGNEEGNSSSSTESSQSSALTGTDGQKFNQITDKYKSQLIALNGEYESRISGLLATAQSEYSTRKKNGSQSDVAALAKKYYGTGKALEAECDGKVYAVINNMESELKRNNLPTSIVGQVRTGYEKEKNDRRKYYMGKALKYL